MMTRESAGAAARGRRAGPAVGGPDREFHAGPVDTRVY